MKQGIPSSAREQLAKQTAPGEHPSADLLNAFVEQSLGSAEKERVTTHLAACAECREVAFLAGAAAGEEDQPAALAQPASSGWHRWLSWKWVVPAVAALAIAAGVTLQHQGAGKPQPATNETIAMNRAAPAPQESATHYEQQTAQKQPDIIIDQTKKAAPAQPPSTRKDMVLDELAAAKPMSPPNRDSGSGGRTLSFAANAPAAAPTIVIKSPPPTLAAKAAATGKDAVVGGFMKPSASGKTEAAGSSSLAAADSSAKMLRKSKAGAAEVAGGPSEVAAAKQNQQAVQQQQTTVDSASGATSLIVGKPVSVPFSTWQITPDGHLERSTGSGEWSRVLADQPGSFHAVALVGDEIWAGGNDGALFHSVDGEQWTKVLISPDEHGAIVAIRFDTATVGTVTTAAGVHWDTTNGGKTWDKQ